MNIIEGSETKRCEQALAQSWDDLGWPDDLAQAKSEEAGLNFINVTIERSRLYEIDQCADQGYYYG